MKLLRRNAMAVATAELPQQEETHLIRSTPYEELLKKIRPDVEQRDIFKSIMLVYCYMRLELGMNHRDISVEEFEVIAGKLESKFIIDNVAREQTLNLGGLIFYFQNNHPFGSDKGWRCFNPYYEWIRDLVREGKHNLVFPPNIQELTKQIYEKRHGQNQSQTPE